METSTPSPAPRFPTFRWFTGRIFSRASLFVVLAIITLIALLYAQVNFRGKRAWDRYRNAAEARGEKLDFAAHIPPPVPDAENGANTPFIQSWFPKPKPDDTNQWPTLFMDADHLVSINRQTKGPGAQDDRFMPDLTAWQEAFAALKQGKTKGFRIERQAHGELDSSEQSKAALAILDALKVYEPVLAELRSASRRPRVHYPVDYKVDDPFSILLPHLAKIKGIVQVLRLQASAELAAGQTDRAFEDIKLMLWLTDSMREEPFLISQLVRIATQAITAQPIWEGIAQHKWSDAQLKEMQEWFLRVNLTEGMSASMRSEKSAGAAIVLRTIKRGSTGELLRNIEFSEGSPRPADFPNRLISWLTPRGFLYFELANYGMTMDDLVANGWDEQAKVFHPAKIDENEKEFKEHLPGPVAAVWHHQVLARVLIPALTKSSRRFSRAQATANQAAIACALERFYLSHQKYPDALSELAPQYLDKIPNEVVSAGPMKYVRNGTGYYLYSNGWDEKDDGGAFVHSKQDEPEKGDWVWRSAP